MCLIRMTKPSLNLEKRVPRNPRYACVAPVVDTGAAASKIHVKPLTDQQTSKRRSELFKRVRCSKLADLLKNIDNTEQPESVYEMAESASQADLSCGISANQGTVISLGALSNGTVSKISCESLGIRDARDSLIVDTRPVEEYTKSRIVLAVNHPGSLISRDVFHKSMHAFKQKTKGRYLLVYHNDDKQSCFYATLLIEKGWEEVFIVDGGFQEFKSTYPELIESEEETSRGGTVIDLQILSKK
jgi:centrosomal protein CEP41